MIIWILRLDSGHYPNTSNFIAGNGLLGSQNQLRCKASLIDPNKPLNSPRDTPNEPGTCYGGTGIYTKSPARHTVLSETPFYQLRGYGGMNMVVMVGYTHAPNFRPRKEYAKDCVHASDEQVVPLERETAGRKEVSCASEMWLERQQ